MRKSNIMRALLSGALAMSVCTVAGCTMAEDGMPSSGITQSSNKFEQALLDSHIMRDGFTAIRDNDAPYSLISFEEIETWAEGSIEHCKASVVIENEYVRQESPVIISIDTTDGEVLFRQNNEDTVSTPLAGPASCLAIDTSAEGITETFDLDSKTGEIRYDNYVDEQCDYSKHYLNGVQTCTWDNEIGWQVSGELEQSYEYIASAFEGTYTLQGYPNIAITVSNVQGDRCDVAVTNATVEKSDGQSMNLNLDLPNAIIEESGTIDAGNSDYETDGAAWDVDLTLTFSASAMNFDGPCASLSIYEQAEWSLMSMPDTYELSASGSITKQ